MLKIINTIFLYFRYITFIGFLYAGIVLFPDLIKSTIGIILLVLILIYSLSTFFMIFIKSSKEEDNILSNIVISLLNIYVMFIAYKYNNSLGFVLANPLYFMINYTIMGFSMIILTVNKFLLWKGK